MRGKKKIHRDEMIMMTINMPDMNFGFSKNIKNYYTRKIEDSAVHQVRSVSLDQEAGQHSREVGTS